MFAEIRFVCLIEDWHICGALRSLARYGRWSCEWDLFLLNLEPLLGFSQCLRTICFLVGVCPFQLLLGQGCQQSRCIALFQHPNPKDTLVGIYLTTVNYPQCSWVAGESREFMGMWKGTQVILGVPSLRTLETQTVHVGKRATNLSSLTWRIPATSQQLSNPYRNPPICLFIRGSCTYVWHS